jgi:bifunctional DNA-binding transcriptional regulator/antitoxin component of YhaV-PrlF toxin-antitoxin module
MRIMRSRITADGDISVPAEVMRCLGVGPGAVLTWEMREGEVVLRRVTTHTSEEVHAALFGPSGADPGAAADVKRGVRTYVQRRHVRS